MTHPTRLRLAIVGATATGKSELGLHIARELEGEVINADSMQLYRGMDIGTAKVPEAVRLGVRHHLLDVLDVTAEASVAAYQRSAVSTVEDIEARARVPILVGGSGLYVSAVVDGLHFPGTDAHVRARLETELAAVGPTAMHARLVETDPVSAARILPTNGRRIVRALEVIEITGSAFEASMPRPDQSGGWIRIGLTGSRPAIDARVKTRVDRMWAAGFVDEVRELERGGLRLGRTASRALGYRQVLEFLDGACTEDQARNATVQATCRFVRRQETWFRRDPTINWIPHDQPLADTLAMVKHLVAGSRSAPAPTGASAEG